MRIIDFLVILTTFCCHSRNHLELIEMKMCCVDFKLNLAFYLKENQNASSIFAVEEMERQFCFRKKVASVTVIFKMF